MRVKVTPADNIESQSYSRRLYRESELLPLFEYELINIYGNFSDTFYFYCIHMCTLSLPKFYMYSVYATVK